MADDTPRAVDLHEELYEKAVEKLDRLVEIGVDLAKEDGLTREEIASELRRTAGIVENEEEIAAFLASKKDEHSEREM